MHEKSKSVLQDEKAESVLRRLHHESKVQTRSLTMHYRNQLIPFAFGRGLRFTTSDTSFYNDKYISIGPNQGELLYTLARSKNASTIVEFGTSYGISTIYLACAVRDNFPPGRVITTEKILQKADTARKNLEDAGVEQAVDIRVGDALATLRRLDRTVDMLLLDGWPTLALPVLKVVLPRLRRGSLVVVDDVNIFKQDLAPLIDFLSDENNGFRSITLQVEDGFFIAIRN